MKNRKAWSTNSNNQIILILKTIFGLRKKTSYLWLLFCLIYSNSSANIYGLNTQTNSPNNKNFSANFLQNLCVDLLKSKKVNNITKIASDNLKYLYLGSSSGKIIKMDPSIKNFEWVADLGGEIASDLIVDQSKLYLMTQLNADDPKKILWSLNTETGVTIWQTVIQSNGTVFLSVYKNQAFIVSKDGLIQSINLSDGKLIIKKSFSINITAPPVFFENRMLIAENNKSILTVNIADFEVIDRIPTIQTAASVLKASDNKLFWGEQNGVLSGYNLATKKKIWSNRYGGEISNIGFTKYGILSSSYDNFIYLNSLSNGKLIWKKRLPGRIAVDSLIIGDRAVFITTGDYNAITVDIDKRKITNQIVADHLGEVIAKPVVFNNFLFLLTNRSLFLFTENNTNCAE